MRTLQFAYYNPSLDPALNRTDPEQGTLTLTGATGQVPRAVTTVTKSCWQVTLQPPPAAHWAGPTVFIWYQTHLCFPTLSLLLVASHGYFTRNCTEGPPECFSYCSSHISTKHFAPQTWGMTTVLHFQNKKFLINFQHLHLQHLET